MWAFGCFVFEVGHRGLLNNRVILTLQKVFSERHPYSSAKDVLPIMSLILQAQSPAGDNFHTIPLSLRDTTRSCWHAEPGRRPTIDFFHHVLEDVMFTSPENAGGASPTLGSHRQQTASDPNSGSSALETESNPPHDMFVTIREPSRCTTAPFPQSTAQATASVTRTPTSSPALPFPRSGPSITSYDSEEPGWLESKGSSSLRFAAAVEGIPAAESLLQAEEDQPLRSNHQSTSHRTEDPSWLSSQVEFASTSDVDLIGKATPRNDRRPSMKPRLPDNEDWQRLQPFPMPPVDRSKPPVMMLPSPPTAPPAIIPKKKMRVLPPRPTSPPPPELIQRATTPTFKQRSIIPPSTSNFRSPPNHVNGLVSPVAGVFDPNTGGRRDDSATSLLFGGSSAVPSRRPSVSSSRSSETHHPRLQSGIWVTELGEEGDATGVIQTLTHTMIGDFLYKYTRRVVGKGHGEKRHRRFFWIHPYTKTLYWSSADPGSASASESSAKSGKLCSLIIVINI